MMIHEILNQKGWRKLPKNRGDIIVCPKHAKQLCANEKLDHTMRIGSFASQYRVFCEVPNCTEEETVQYKPLT